VVSIWPGIIDKIFIKNETEFEITGKLAFMNILIRLSINSNGIGMNKIVGGFNSNVNLKHEVSILNLFANF
jgi:hypothetical protein